MGPGICLSVSSQVPRPSCVEGRENEGSKTAEFSFIGRLRKIFSWKVGKGAHNWNRQHVNSNFFSDDPSISQLGAAVEPLFSLRPIFHFPSANFPLPCSAFFNWISLQIIFHICFPLSNCMCWFATSLRPIFHFPSANFPLSFAQSATENCQCLCFVLLHTILHLRRRQRRWRRRRGKEMCCAWDILTCNCNVTLSSGCEAAFDQWCIQPKCFSEDGGGSRNWNGSFNCSGSCNFWWSLHQAEANSPITACAAAWLSGIVHPGTHVSWEEKHCTIF